MKKRNRNKKNYIRKVFFTVAILMVVVCWQNLEKTGNVSILQEILAYGKNNFYMKTIKTHMPVVMAATEDEGDNVLFRDYFMETIMGIFPIHNYVLSLQEQETQVESELSYEMLMAREGIDEQYRDGELMTESEIKDENIQQEIAEVSEKSVPTGTIFTPVAEPVVHISREKLNDFDYLIHNFYVVDRTTTIDSNQLNAQKLLGKDMKLSTTADKPQILIHHTHSQEGFVGSTEDPATTIIGVGAYLTKLLEEQYGFNVIHDTGAYDLIDHDDAYSHAGPAVEKILAENPSIEVVIDLHRDGIGEGHLVTEVNGKQTAQIMFFNGLSRTTANGNLDYLNNPYLEDNLALSLQMKIAAEEYYPGFTRPNYLKGYRYNLHYRPKSMLIEVGAQTNTVQEAMNAMEPLADLLYKVLSN